MILGVYFILCLAIHVLAPAISRSFISDFALLPHSVRLSWYNRLVSSLHAVLMSCLAIHYWIWINPEHSFANTVNSYQRSAMDAMIAFLCYDVLYELYFSKSYDTMMHHILGLAVHLLTRYYDSGASMFYLMVVYLAELSTPLLHLTWLFFQLGRNTTLAFYFLQTLLLFVFLFCRVILGAIMFGHMLLYKRFWGHQVLLYYFCSVVCIIFVVMNLKWFRSLLSLAFKSKSDENSS